LNATTTSTTTTYTAAGKHNVYKAVVDGTDTISQLCANCHGNFHVDTKGTAWQRHPTDVLIPTGWEIQTGTYTINDRDLKYNPPGYNGAEGGAGTRYATCLSCHRAHGTGNKDLLRFGYVTGDASPVEQSAGSGKAYGCLGCHSKQR
jgi:cytochrome c553